MTTETRYRWNPEFHKVTLPSLNLLFNWEWYNMRSLHEREWIGRVGCVKERSYE